MKLDINYLYRWLMAGAFVWIMLSGVYFMLLYWLVLLACLEWLNTRQFYLKTWRSLNWFFTGYLYFILLIRAFPWTWNAHFREAVNIAEHLLFAMLVCTLLFLGSLALYPRISLYKRIIGAYCCFNIIGIINEVYQNIIVGRLASVFISDSLKDIAVNLLGGLLAALILLFIAKQRPTLSAITSTGT